MQQQSEEEGPSDPKPGEAMQQALAARGATISVDEAARLAKVFLDLFDQGLIVPVDRVTSSDEDSVTSEPPAT